MSIERPNKHVYTFVRTRIERGRGETFVTSKRLFYKLKRDNARCAKWNVQLFSIIFIIYMKFPVFCNDRGTTRNANSIFGKHERSKCYRILLEKNIYCLRRESERSSERQRGGEGENLFQSMFNGAYANIAFRYWICYCDVSNVRGFKTERSESALYG